jgi:endonuclease III
MLCGAAPAGLPLESNGLRVLTRLGFGREDARNYARTYQSVQDALIQEIIPQSADSLAEAHLLLREHGKQVCRANLPQCENCSISSLCCYPAKR